jgi:prepilin-type processing-associated H-X9-DG protein
VDTRVAGKRRVILLGCLLAAIVLGIGAYRTILPMLNRAREVSRMRDASNMRQIGQALMLYATNHQGRYPPLLADLLIDEDITTEVFVSPQSNDTKAVGDTIAARIAALESGGHQSYIYVPNLNPAVDPKTVLLYEPLSLHNGFGMNVLYGDGHVEFDDAKQAAGIIAELNAGFNPPRAGHY